MIDITLRVAYILIGIGAAILVAHSLLHLGRSREGSAHADTESRSASAPETSPEQRDRQATRLGKIDGLRGYLALAVFVYHFFLTHQWHNGAAWPSPTPAAIRNLGEVGVSVFFMITGFLFIHRLRERQLGNREARSNETTVKEQPWDFRTRFDAWRREWSDFIVRRICRIYPLYLSAMVIIVGISLSKTGMVMNDSPRELLVWLIKWLGFSATPLNGVEHAPIMLARVEWTLRYEWVFYLSLPLVALSLSKARAFAFIVTSAAVAGALWPVETWISFLRLESKFLFLFVLGGWLAEAKLQEMSPVLRSVPWRSGTLSIIALACLATVVFGFNTAYGFLQACLLAVFLLMVVMDNTLFGLLALPASRLLGEISYSIYLIHGLVLYVFFTLLLPDVLVGEPIARAGLWLPVAASLVTATAWFTYNAVEARGIRLGRYLTRRK